MDQNTMEKGGMCGCGCHKAMPWGLIIIGLAAILGNLNILSMMVVSYVWPIALIGIGFSKMCKCCGRK
jgi:hypothetical protein